MDNPSIPSGYMERADGALIPINKIKPVDRARDNLVRALCESAKSISGEISSFKIDTMNRVSGFIEHSLKDYDVAHGGKKGNVTLVSFDGRFKVVRQIQDSIVFDERLQAAKALIDECILRWGKNSNNNIKVLVNDAFQVDNAGTINTSRVLRLRGLAIEDAQWDLAMKAINDSMQVQSSKPYIRFYERCDETGEYKPIPIDIAAV